MKKNILICGMAIICFFAACSKNDPTPPPDNQLPPTGSSGESFGVSDFDPKTGPIGTVVTIKGLAFGTDSNQVSIKFNGATAVKPKTITNSEMTVIVPTSTQTGTIQVAVKNGTPATTYSSFTVTATKQTITGFSPKTVTQGDTLKITGTLFGSSVSAVLVYFNRSISDLGTRPFSVTPTEIDVVVPSNTITGNFNVFVQGLGTVASTESLTFVPMTNVTAVTPASARAGEIVSINGDFPYSDDLNTVKVRFTGSANDIVPLKNDGRNNILVRVPTDAKTGKIKVTRNGYTGGLTSNTFTVLSPLPQPVSATWTKGADYASYGKVGSIAFTIGTKAYIGLGSTNAPFDGIGSNDFWEFDTQYNAWTQKANFGGGLRVTAAAFAIGSKGYVGTGVDNNNSPTSDFWEYDPATNVWAQKADFKGGARLSAVGFAIGNLGYVGAGGNRTSSLNDFYSYNPTTNTWAQTASIPGSRSQAFNFVIGNKAYVGNGYNSSVTSLQLDLYMYDPATNAWTAKAAIPGFATYGSTAFSIGDKGYVGLGNDYSSSATTAKFYEYSTTANSWRAIANFGGGVRTSAVGFAIGNVAYVGMGTTANSLVAVKDFWVYTP
jgi:hypothetical protein